MDDKKNSIKANSKPDITSTIPTPPKIPLNPKETPTLTSASTQSESSTDKKETPPTPFQEVVQNSKKENASKVKTTSPATAFAALAFVLAFAACVFAAMTYFDSRQVVTTSAGEYYQGNSTTFKDTNIASAVSKVTPAVVSILGQTEVRDYFGGVSDSTSAGTGVIVTEDGYIITNKHVIQGVRKISVVTDSGDSYDDVSVVGTDPMNDIAYLKINGASKLTAANLGDSKTIATGQPVLAIGNALGVYQNSVSQGIISGTGRSVNASDSTGANQEVLTDMIQTDAAINPGNSGGPLVNAAGDVIGINTAVSTDANGLGFAIPISSTKGMLNNIIKNHKAERAYVGVNYLPVTSDVAKEYNLPVKQGAYVYAQNGDPVVAGSPAAKAGIKSGDIITKVNGVNIGSAGSVSTLVGEYTVGDKITFTIIRDGQEKNLLVTLAAYSGTNY